MPPPVDLRGRRFGSLVAVRSLPGRRPTIWECLCDCGESCLAPLNRLSTHDNNPRAIRACETCRARRCSICGAPYLKSGSTATCGADECRLAHRRAVNRAAYDRGAERNGISKRAVGHRSKAAAADPSLLAALIETDRERARATRRDMSDDDRAERRAAERALYARNRDLVREKFRQWLAAMPPERRAEWDAKARATELRYRGRRMTARMMQDAAALLEIMEKSDE